MGHVVDTATQCARRAGPTTTEGMDIMRSSYPRGKLWATSSPSITTEGTIMHAGGMTGGSTTDPIRTDIEKWFSGPDRANDCRNSIMALKREANQYGRVVERYAVTQRGDTTILKVVLRDAPKHRPGRKFRPRDR